MDPTNGLSIFLQNAFTLIAIISEVINLFMGIGNYIVQTIQPLLSSLAAIPTDGAT